VCAEGRESFLDGKASVFHQAILQKRLPTLSFIRVTLEFTLYEIQTSAVEAT